MVFGTTYCSISHLPIEDGDKCVLIPLGFRMQSDFSRGNYADINCFAYLHTFIARPVIVKYGGNYSECNYWETTDYHKAGEGYQDYEMYMLVHYKFYQKILENFDLDFLKKSGSLPLFNTVYPLWEKVQSNKNLVHSGWSYRMGKGEITAEELKNLFLEHSPEEWIIELYKVAWFMGQMGIAPHPTFCNDQNETGKIYEKMRKESK